MIQIQFLGEIYSETSSSRTLKTVEIVEIEDDFIFKFRIIDAPLSWLSLYTEIMLAAFPNDAQRCNILQIIQIRCFPESSSQILV